MAVSTLSIPIPAPPAPGPWRSDAAVIGLVGLAHGLSHFCQLLLPPLFPWLKDAFAVSYAQLGFLLTLYFVVSCLVQAAAGFAVDRWGPRPVLFAGLGLLALATAGFALSTHYAALALFAVVAGVGNGVFHPVDYTLLNRKVTPSRLGHAYSVHGVTGSLGWALAPALMVPLAVATSWRVALGVAAALVLAVLAVLWWRREVLALSPAPPGSAPPSSTASTAQSGGPAVSGTLDFLRLPAVWMCFAFFFFYAGALSVVQTFAPEAARQLHGVPLALVAVCLTAYMLSAALGMVGGGFLATDARRCERVVAVAFGCAALIAVSVAVLHPPPQSVPLLFALMGLAAGLAGPSRDLIVKRAAPDHATGRVYGVVYGGLDIGQALVPLAIGWLMDQGQWQAVWLALALLQLVLVASALQVRRARRLPKAQLA